MSSKEGDSDHRPRTLGPKDFVETEIPRPAGDLYDGLLRPLLEEDRIQCDAWKEEVQNLLIFAGLFSGVLTAFIVESYKGLQPDLDESVVGLLALIASRLEPSTSPFNDTSPGMQYLALTASSPFSPTPSTIRVNTFWFISLVLSLTTVLVGIVSLQWIREHQQYDLALEPEVKFAVFNMRRESMEKWHVSKVFLALPLVLQVALLLFFAGTIDFLLALSHAVAIPVIIVTGFPILFLLATTAMPTFQAYVMYDPISWQVNNKVPIPCPYKSPQSFLFRRLAMLSKFWFLVCRYAFAMVYFPFAVVPQLVIASIRRGPRFWRCSFTWARPPFHALRPHSPREPGLQYWFHLWQYSSWLSSDCSWTRLRTEYWGLLAETKRPFADAEMGRTVPVGDALARFNEMFNTQMHVVFDCVKGFQSVFYGNRDSDMVHRAYHCANALSVQFMDLMKNTTQFGGGLIRTKSHHLEILLRSDIPTIPTDIPRWIVGDSNNEDPANFAILQDFQEFAILSSIVHLSLSDRVPPSPGKRWAEYQLKIMAPLLLGDPGHLLQNSNGMMLFGLRSVWDSMATRRVNTVLRTADPAWTAELSARWKHVFGVFSSKLSTTNSLLDHRNMRMDFMTDGIKTYLIDPMVGSLTWVDCRSMAKKLAGLLRNYLFKSTPADPRPDDLAYIACLFVQAMGEKQQSSDNHNLHSLVELFELVEVLKTFRDFHHDPGRTLLGNVHLQRQIDAVCTTWLLPSAVPEANEQRVAIEVRSILAGTPPEPLRTVRKRVE